MRASAARSLKPWGGVANTKSAVSAGGQKKEGAEREPSAEGPAWETLPSTIILRVRRWQRNPPAQAIASTLRLTEAEIVLIGGADSMGVAA